MAHITKFDKVILEGDGYQWLSIDWHLTNLCNYQCSYCAPRLHDGSAPSIDIEILKRFCDNVLFYAGGKNKRVLFGFSGGEVTYLKYFPELLEHVAAKQGLARIVSNASSPLSWWENNVKYLYCVTLSLHLDQLKDLDHFISVAKLVNDSPTTYLNIAVMMDPRHFERGVLWTQEIKRNVRASITLMPLFHGFGTSDTKKEFFYTAEQKNTMKTLKGEWVKKDIPTLRGGLFLNNGQETQFVSASDLLKGGLNRFYGWSCNAGVENIIVRLDGNIFRCWRSQGGRIGTIFDDANPFREIPITCRSPDCPCTGDICTTKTKLNPELGKRWRRLLSYCGFHSFSE
jgi:sulfatase maturation enzyme AslB (radical SAM superfamily)